MLNVDDQDTRRANMRYIRNSMKEPLLSRDDEKKLAMQWSEDNDEKALHKLIRAYTKLVITNAGRFKNYGLPIGDLMQEGNVGLMQAAARFDPSRDIRFSTYANWWIRSSMQDYILRNWSIVRIGTTAAQKTLFFNLRRLRVKINDAPSGAMTEKGRKDVADQLHVPLRDVEAMEKRIGTGDQSLQITVSDDFKSDFQDFISDERPTPDMVVEKNIDSNKYSTWLSEAIRKLNEREQIIIQKRRMVENGASLEELGKLLGISKERVRQLECRAMDKLKKTLVCNVDNMRDLLFNNI